jgi:hypothetical protein
MAILAECPICNNGGGPSCLDSLMGGISAYSAYSGH